MKIALDLDGVLADFEQHVFDQYHKWYGRAVPKKARVVWNSVFEKTHGDEKKTWQWLMQIPDFWATIPVIPGAPGGVLDLLLDGHEIIILTHRPRSSVNQTQHWIDSWWPARYQHPRVHWIDGFKGAIDADVYVDDSPEVLESFQNSPKPCIRFAQPWNRGVKATAVASNWTELLTLIKRLGEDGDMDDQLRLIDDFLKEEQ